MRARKNHSLISPSTTVRRLGSRIMASVRRRTWIRLSQGARPRCGRDDTDRSVVDRDIDVECAAGLAWRDTQVNAPDREDREARKSAIP